jgi:hypothetical protein
VTLKSGQRGKAPHAAGSPDRQWPRLDRRPGQPARRRGRARGGHVVIAGAEERARGAISRNAVAIDAGSRTVLPGLIDAHNPNLATAEALAPLDVWSSGTPDVATAAI